MRLKEKNLLQKFAATLKKFSAQGAKKVEYGSRITSSESISIHLNSGMTNMWAVAYLLL